MKTLTFYLTAPSSPHVPHFTPCIQKLFVLAPPFACWMALSVAFPQRERGIDSVLLINQELFGSRSQNITLSNNVYLVAMTGTDCCIFFTNSQRGRCAIELKG